MTQTWLNMSACDLGRGLESGEIDAFELTRTYLDAMERHEATDTVYAAVTVERALAEARSASIRQKAGRRLSLLDGVPISWKDLIDTRGVKTEAGSPIYSGRVPASDAEVLNVASKAGLVCLGKTHLSEFAFSGLGVNPNTATPGCIHDPGKAPGGSSSGAAASVANGLAAAGIGSDTGGSVRVPSAWNDLVGLKTTFGRIPMEGVVPLCSSFDSIGPLCRTVEDAVVLFSLMCGNVNPVIPRRSLQGSVFLVPQNGILGAVDDEPQSAFEDAVGKLVEQGARIVRHPVGGMERSAELAGSLYSTEAYATHWQAIGEGWNLIFEPIRKRILAGRDTPASTYISAMDELHALRRIYQRETRGFDGLLLPASPIMPPEIDRLISDMRFYTEMNLLALRNTRVANLMDAPSLTLPTGQPSTGLMIIGHRNEDMALLGIGAAIEKVLTPG